MAAGFCGHRRLGKLVHRMADSPSDHVSCLTCPNRAKTEWSALNESELNRLDSVRSCRQLDTGETVFFEGDPCDGVFCVEGGLIGIRKGDSDGNSVLLRLASPGDTLGYRAFLSSEDHHTSAEALAKTTLCFIPRDNLRALLAENPELGLRFLKHATADLDDTETKLLQSAAQTARERLVHVLLLLREQLDASPDQDGTVTFTLPISRQDLASMIRSRPETLSRTIKQMDDEGAVHFKGRQVTIPSLDDLLDEII